MRSCSTLLFSLLLVVSHALPQTVRQSTCGPPPAILQSTQPNIFSEQQEEWLGEAMADYIDREFRPVKNSEENAYVAAIGDRLLAALPPTKIKFHFALVESIDVNGFSLAGGRVYLTRKLVASAHNEDEVAGVIAHEMGHILSHQFAIETTADLHRLLGVTSVTDRADIYAKFQRLTDARLHDRNGTNGDSDENQDGADRVAVYAAAAAGYRPQAYAEFWDRSFFVGGKTGSRLGDFFQTTTPTQKRLRRIRGIIAELPVGCGAIAANTPPAFEHWHTLVLENQAAAAPSPSGPGASTATVQLTPPLHLEIERLRFSRDGLYILAQDESSIFVLSRSPFRHLFRFDAEHAFPADFTPDSKQIAFYNRDLHVELWSVAQQKLVSAHEVVAQEECLQTLLSPDGRTLICIAYPPASSDLKLLLIDVETGKVVFENSNWFQPSVQLEYSVYANLFTRSGVLPSAFSADGNTLLLGPAPERVAFDLRTRTPLKISGALTGNEFPISYCFLGNDKVLAIHGSNPMQSGVFTFPEGKRLQSIKLDLPFLDATTGAEHIITSGPHGPGVGVVDVNAAKYVLSSKSSAVDVIGGSFVSENVDGSIYLGKLGDRALVDGIRADMPLSPLPAAGSVTLSPDGRYLALSARTRGAVWDLATGRQIFLVRGFRSSWWTPEGKLFAEFSRIDKDHPTVVAELTLEPHSAKNMGYKLPEQAHLANDSLLEWTSQNKKAWTLTAYSPADLALKWTRNFPDGRPGYTTNDGDTDLIFSDLLQSPAAKAKLRGNPAIKGMADAVKQKAAGRLIEIVNAEDGTMRAQVIVEVPLTYQGVVGFNKIGDLLYLSTGDNRTIVYSIKTGTQLRQLFGTVVAADQSSQIVCTTNRRDEVIVSDRSGGELFHLAVGSPIRFVELRDHGTQLLILTADQIIRRYNIPVRFSQNELQSTASSAP
ncbi:M48 family metalloprotease [Tunturiibacter gelidoferens]|uniref:WD40 repeat protein n=1 Tax=Tunturiibacter lichenicola TaxID=2051959 RepID=A0A7Y9T3R4_9BACT|nr:M48 family metalloprotease [Edaphobacter lichenicola]NYF53158.1 WD40 repeat protein [Edaphobacter lichenicola]